MDSVKPPYEAVVERLNLLPRLAPFTPVVIGTPPLGLAMAESDIDIACTAPDLDRFSAIMREEFGKMAAFTLRRMEHFSPPAVVASFKAMGWEIELFCQTIPTECQRGVRHFRIEKRLLALAPSLLEAVMRLRRQGLKTEPAFAKVLSLSGDPYVALLELEGMGDARLQDIINAAI